ncbi:MAG TPA: response regulator [Opitutaceae bacterium]
MLRSIHRILLIDDDFDARLLSERALKKSLTAHSTVHLVHSGNQAIRYMIGEGQYADRRKYPFPTLVITDINMPDGDGFDVLEFLQTNPEWGVVPRIVVSSSNDDDDVRTAFLLGASAYHLKPIGYQELSEFMRTLLGYWTLSEVPPVDETGRLLTTNSSGRRGARFPQPKGGAAMKRPRPRSASALSASKASDAG